LFPVDVVAKPQEWFVFGSERGELRFRTTENWITGCELPPMNFLCPTSDADYRNPYGDALLASCFWPATFKKGGWRFWVSFAEKYGQAFAVGKIRRAATKSEMEELADMLEAMVQDAIAVIYDDSSVELKTVDSKGASSALFQNIISEANTAISTVILGHAGAGQSTSGKLGDEGAAIAVREDFKDGDKKLVCRTMNELIRRVAEVNWGGGELPVFSLWEEEDVDKAQAERDAALSGPLEKSSLKLSKSYYLRTYNLEETDLEETAATGIKPGKLQNPLEFAAARQADEFPGQVAIDSWLGSMSPAENQRHIEDVVKPIVAKLLKFSDYDGALTHLAAAYPEMNTDTLVSVLSRMMFTADLVGRYEAMVDGGN
jgi:phage gp29-like protein